MEAVKDSNEFNRWCPWSMCFCRRDCVAYTWSDTITGYVCRHNAEEIVIVKKKIN